MILNAYYIRLIIPFSMDMYQCRKQVMSAKIEFFSFTVERLNKYISLSLPIYY